VLAHDLEEQVGVEVDFAILRQSELPKLAFTLMNAELQFGHRVIVGDDSVLNSMQAMPVDNVPLPEFTRLMLNRGSLLLINSEELSRGGPVSTQDREQFGRYLDKALFACADARLAAAGQYHPCYSVKRERLANLSWRGSRDFLARYDRALESRVAGVPMEISAESATDAQAVVVADWLEALVELEKTRLGSLPEWQDYCRSTISKGQSGSGLVSQLRNVAVTIRDFGLAEIVHNSNWARRYPRERLISVLPALLDPALKVPRKYVARALSMKAKADERALSDSFLSYWARYN